MIHPTAIVEDGAIIGPDTSIWHWVHVVAGAQIGARCVLGQNVFVAGRVKIGDGCRIQNNVSLYDGVVLKDHVFCGPSVVFTNVKTPRAHIRRNTPSHFQPTVVHRGATLGANSTIVCGVELGEYAFVAAGAVVTHDVLPHALVVGVPAVQTGWVCQCGVTLESSGSEYQCDQCGDRWVEAQGRLRTRERP